MGSELEGVLQCGAYFPGTVLDIFRAADTNCDGLVSGKEAVDFFVSTGLLKTNLSQVWEAATASQPGGLTPAQFSRALRLVSLLQVGCVFSKEFVDKALHPTTGLQLPTPTVGEQFLAYVPQEIAGNQPASTTAKPVEAPKPALPKAATCSPPKPARKPPAPVPASATPEPKPSTARVPSPNSSPVKVNQDVGVSVAEYADGPGSAEGSPTAADDDEAVLAANSWRRHAPANTLRIDVRLQPHNAAAAAPVQRLCAVQEALLAAPTRAGGMLCFARADYKPSDPPSEWPLVRNGEDPMSAFGRECLPERVQANAVTAMHVCPYTEMLISGHRDGTAILWHVNMASTRAAGEPPMQQRLLVRAHSRSAVVAALTTPWGALWTAGSSGSLRWLPTAAAEALAAPHTTAFDFRALPQCELRRASGERAHGAIASLQLTSGGQIVVAASRNRATLWDAFSGRFLGVVAVAGCPLDTPHLVDPGAGLPLATSGGRAASSPEGPLPPLGTAGEDMLPGEEARLAQRLNTVALTTSSIAKKGFSGMKSIVSRQLSKGMEALMAPQGGQPPLAALPAPLDECGEDPEAEEQAAAPATARRVFFVCTPDNHIWCISEVGVVEVFSASGKHDGKFEAAFASAVCCAAAFGGLVWLGLASGRVVAVDCRTRARVTFQDVHTSAVVSLQQVGLTMYALAASGAISGINACVLPKTLPSGCVNPGHTFWQGCWRRALEVWGGRVADSVDSVAVGLRVATWNVGEGRPGRDSIKRVLGVADDLDRDLSADGIDILVVALQEIEMGTASVAVGAVKEVMGKKVAEQGNHNARWWGDEMSACLGQGCPLSGSGTHRHSWERIAMRQMSGLLLCVYSRRAMCSNVANTATGVVACGVGGFGGNKGAVAVSFSLFGQRVLVMNSHFAAHQGAVRKRNADYRAIISRLALPYQPALVATENPTGEPLPGQAGVHSMPLAVRNSQEQWAPPSRREESLPNPAELPRVAGDAAAVQAALERPDAAALGFRSAALTVWTGDFNYRIDMTRSAVDSALKTGRTLETLKSHDQARRQMVAGAVFHGMREAALTFPPTYKFDKGVPGPLAYDSSEKLRIPAWTDRVFFKGSVPFPRLETPTAELDFVPAAASPYPTAGVTREGPDQLLVRCSHYTSLPEVCDSDHKPVVARLRADVPSTDHKRRRRHVGKILSDFHAEVTSSLAPHIRLPSASLSIHGDSATFAISNNGHGDGAFQFRGWALPSGAEAPPGAGGCMLPPWLSVFPIRGSVPAGGSVDVHVAVNRVRACFGNEALSQQKTVNVDLYMVVDGLRQGGTSTTEANILKLEVSFRNEMT